MGIASPGEPDVRRAGASFSFTALNQVSAWVQIAGQFGFAAGGDGAGVGSVGLEVSFDGGATFYNASKLDGTPNSWATPFALAPTSPGESGVLHRARCTAYTSGTINGRLSQ
jgi:hypothetical protein